MRSIRAKSLLIDCLFTAVPLPHGDDARSFIARCMGYDNQTPGQQAQSDEPFLPEAEAMLGDVLPVLRFVPFVFHFRFKSTVTLFVVTRKDQKTRMSGATSLPGSQVLSNSLLKRGVVHAGAVPQRGFRLDAGTDAFEHAHNFSHTVAAAQIFHRGE